MRGEADCQCEDGLAIEYTRDSVGGLLDRFSRDVEMRDSSTAAGADGVEQQAVLFESRHEFLRRHLLTDHVEEQNVGVDCGGINRDPGNLL